MRGSCVRVCVFNDFLNINWQIKIKNKFLASIDSKGFHHIRHIRRKQSWLQISKNLNFEANLRRKSISVLTLCKIKA